MPLFFATEYEGVWNILVSFGCFLLFCLMLLLSCILLPFHATRRFARKTIDLLVVYGWILLLPVICSVLSGFDGSPWDTGFVFLSVPMIAFMIALLTRHLLKKSR